MCIWLAFVSLSRALSGREDQLTLQVPAPGCSALSPCIDLSVKSGAFSRIERLSEWHMHAQLLVGSSLPLGILAISGPDKLTPVGKGKLKLLLYSSTR